MSSHGKGVKSVELDNISHHRSTQSAANASANASHGSRPSSAGSISEAGGPESVQLRNVVIERNVELQTMVMEAEDQLCMGAEAEVDATTAKVSLLEKRYASSREGIRAFDLGYRCPVSSNITDTAFAEEEGTSLLPQALHNVLGPILKGSTRFGLNDGFDGVDAHREALVAHLQLKDAPQCTPNLLTGDVDERFAVCGFSNVLRLLAEGAKARSTLVRECEAAEAAESILSKKDREVLEALSAHGANQVAERIKSIRDAKQKRESDIHAKKDADKAAAAQAIHAMRENLMGAMGAVYPKNVASSDGRVREPCGRALALSLSHLAQLAVSISSASDLPNLLLKTLEGSDEEYERNLTLAEGAYDDLAEEKTANVEKESGAIADIQWHERTRSQYLRRLEAALLICKDRLCQLQMLQVDPCEEAQDANTDNADDAAQRQKSVVIVDDTTAEAATHGSRPSTSGSRPVSALRKQIDEQRRRAAEQQNSRNASIREQFEKHHSICFEVIEEEVDARVGLLKRVDRDFVVVSEALARENQDNNRCTGLFNIFQESSFAEMEKLEKEQIVIWDEVQEKVAQLHPLALARHALVEKHLAVSEEEHQRRRVSEERTAAGSHHLQRLEKLRRVLRKSLDVLSGIEDFHNGMAHSITNSITNGHADYSKCLARSNGQQRIPPVPSVAELNAHGVLSFTALIDVDDNSESALSVRALRLAHQRKFNFLLHQYVNTVQEVVSSKHARILLAEKTLRTSEDVLSGITGERDHVQLIRKRASQERHTLMHELNTLVRRVAYYAPMHVITTNALSSIGEICEDPFEQYQKWESILENMVSDLHVHDANDASQLSEALVDISTQQESINSSIVHLHEIRNSSR